MNSIFITGIDTGVGKTFVSAIFIKAFTMNYWKPVQTGNQFDNDSSVINNLVPETKIFPEAYSLKIPASPHIAASNENIQIDLNKINLPESPLPLVVEGAGGVLVPLNDDSLMIDLIKKFNLKVVIVLKNYLGCINHALLTFEAIKSRNINIAGWIINGNNDTSIEDTIIKRTGIPILLKIFQEQKIDSEIVLKYATRLQENAKFI